MDDTREIKMSEVFSEPPESVMSRGDSFFTRTKQDRTWVRKYRPVRYNSAVSELGIIFHFLHWMRPALAPITTPAKSWLILLR